MDQHKNNEITTNDQITFADFIKMFNGKLKIIICIILISALLGSVAGFAITLLSVSYTGNVEFYITPDDTDHRLLPLLQSDSFAEKLLLDEYGLPIDADKDSQEYKDAKAAVIAAEEARKTKQDIVKEYDKLHYALTIAEDRYNKLNERYESVVEELSIYKNAESGKGDDSLDPAHKAKVAALEAELEDIKQQRNEYAEKEYFPIVQTRLELYQEINTARLKMKELRENAEEMTEKLLEAWRALEDVSVKIAKIQKSVTYEYAKIVDDNKNSTNVDNQNQAVLVVSVNVNNDEELANEIVSAIKERLPIYAEVNVEIITGTNEAECRLISTFASVESSASKNLIKNTVIYAIVLSAIVTIIYIAAVIIKSTLPEDWLSESKANNKKDSNQAE